MKKAIVFGAGGFIGHNLVSRLKSMGYWVRGIDLKYPEFEETKADEFKILDLRVPVNVTTALTLDSLNEQVDEVYQLGADMGGAGFVFTGEHDSDIMTNSSLINLNVLQNHKKYKKIFYSSSACIYPAFNQVDPDNPNCAEDTAYPANPDSDYGWEKLFSERLYLSYHRNYGVDVRIARFHNIFGINGTYTGGREKAPAATCRKVIEALPNGIIEVWGPGTQTRSFLYIDDCIDGVLKLMDSEMREPINIGSEEMITINDLTKMAMKISGRTDLTIKNVDGPIGVMGRNSDNNWCRDKLGWEPTMPLVDGMTKTFEWIVSRHEYDNIDWSMLNDGIVDPKYLDKFKK